MGSGWGAGEDEDEMRRAALILVVLALLGLHAPGGARADLRTTVYRDRFGVPHIEAPTLGTAAYAMGYVTAKDRLFEMDIFRKLSQGRLSEFVGPPMLPMDELVRREFVLPGQLHAQYLELSSDVRSMLDAYTQGINDAALKTYLDPRTRPALYDILAIPWERWKAEDSLGIATIFASDLFGGDGAAGQLNNAAILQRLQNRYGTTNGLNVFNDVFPPAFSDAPTIVAPGDGPAAPPPGSGYDIGSFPTNQLAATAAPGAAAAAGAQFDAITTARALLQRYGIPLPHLGSFGAAVSGERTASHGALLMGSPQAGLESPPIFYELGYHVPGITDCEGIGVPGLGPAVVIGWCNQHAWTLISANVGDQADLYVEQIAPGDPHRYWFKGAWQNTEQRSTTYLVKGAFTCRSLCPPQVITRTYDYTVHGAINSVDGAHGVGFAFRRAQTGLAGYRNLEATIAENLSKTYDEFRDGLDLGTATLHLLYADQSGRIAYRFTGLQPIRPGFDRRFPMPGTGEAEWQGFLSACAMPNVVDPAAGYLAVNQGTESKPISWWPNSPFVGIGIVARPGYDQQLLAGIGPDTLEVQRQLERRYLMEDDPQAALFYPLFAHALAGSTDPLLNQALAQLEAWRADGFRRTDRNGDGQEDHPGLTIFEMDHYDEYGKGPAYPTPLGDEMVSAAFSGPVGDSLPGSTAMARYSALYDALTGQLSRDYVGGDTDAFIRAAVAKVVTTLSHRFDTTDMSKWHDPYPAVKFTSIGLTGPPAVKGFDHGSFSQIVDLGAGAGEDVEPPGNVAADSGVETAQTAAGHPPAHSMDQWAMYNNYQYKPMLMSATQYRSQAESVTVLDPPGSLGAAGPVRLSGRDRCRG